MQRMVAMLPSACMGERALTRNLVCAERVSQSEPVHDGDLCLFAAVTKSASRSICLVISAKAKMRCQIRVPFLVAQRESGKI